MPNGNLYHSNVKNIGKLKVGEDKVLSKGHYGDLLTN
jgi:hypothetical protein